MNFGGLSTPLGPIEGELRSVLAPSVAFDPSEDMDALVADIEAKRAVAWVATDDRGIRGAVIVEVHGTKARQCLIRHCAGQALREWLPFLAVIEGWAKDIEGCTSIELIGREGWERKLGWPRTGVQLRKAL